MTSFNSCQLHWGESCSESAATYLFWQKGQGFFTPRMKRKYSSSSALETAVCALSRVVILSCLYLSHEGEKSGQKSGQNKWREK